MNVPATASLNVETHLEVRRGHDGSHPRRVVGRKLGNKQGCLRRSKIDRREAVGLAHPEQVVERRLLTENRLVVGLVALR